MLLAGEMDPFPVLREQFAAVRVTERDDFGSGYNLKLAVPDDVPRIMFARLDLQDVALVMSGGGLPGCTLTVLNGELSTFEYDCYEDDPDRPPQVVRLNYSAHLVGRDDEGEMIQSAVILLQERDWDVMRVQIAEHEEMHRRRVAKGEWQG